MYKSKDFIIDKLNISESELGMWKAIGHIKYSERTDKYDIDSVLEMRTMTLGLEKILNEQQYNEVLSLMKSQSSLQKRIFQDFQHDRALGGNQYDKIAQKDYGLKSYFGLSAYQFAKGSYESMNTWYIKTIENLQNKIIQKEKDLQEFILNHNNFKPGFIKGKKHQLQILKNKLTKYQSKGYLSTWFGNKKPNNKDEYFKSRLSLVIAGEEAKGGNRFIRIRKNKENNYELKLFGHNIDIKVPKSHLNTFSLDEFNRQTARINFNSKGKLVLNITYNYIKPISKFLTEKSYGNVGIDIGPKEIAVAFIKNDGNTLIYKHYPIGNNLDARSKETKRRLSEILDDIVKLAIHYKMYQITIENLKFKPDHKFKSKSLNRMLSKFPRTMFKVLLESKCNRNGLKLKLINPAYTSVIGLFKYSNIHNLCTSHNAKSKDLSTAYVIGRRGLGLKEKGIINLKLFGKIVSIPIKSLLTLLEDNVSKFDRNSKTNSNWSLWSRLKKLFKTTDELTAHLLANPKTLVALSEIKGSRCDSLNLALIKIGATN